MEEQIWKTIFCEIALKSLRIININYGIWTLGQSCNHDLKGKIKNINTKGGIELVLEQEVCSEITRQFLNSPSCFRTPKSR